MKFKDMTNEELCVLYQSTKCEMAFEVLYKRNYKLITAITSKFISKDSVVKHSDDYMSEANIAFYNACMAYDVNSNVKFSTLAHKFILNSCKQVIRMNNMAKRNCTYTIVPLDGLLNVKNPNLIISESISYDEPVFAEPNLGDKEDAYAETYNRIYKTLKKKEVRCIDTQVKIFELFSQGYTQKQIAEKLNMTHQNVSASVKVMRKTVLNLGYRY